MMEVAVRCSRLHHHHGRGAAFGGALAAVRRGPPPISSSRRFHPRQRGGAVRCSGRRDAIGSEEWLAKASPYEVLGVDEFCTPEQVKAAFRARVLSNTDGEVQMVQRESTDPFEEPECEALDIFVDETRCIGKGCPYSCVKRAPHAFSFNPMTGAARASSQGHGDDYLVQLSVGQCPRNCIYYVTPLQRVILEEILSSILQSPYATSEVNSLDSLLAKAKFENNRYQKPKRNPTKNSTQFVDWF